MLLLSKYDRLGASSRVRSYQYLGALRDLGIDVKVAPLFGNGYLRELYLRRQRSIKEVAAAYARRVVQLASSFRYQLLWTEKEILPWLPAVCEIGLTRGGMSYVVDYDDAVFDFHSRGAMFWARRLRDRGTHSLMRRAAVVVVGNQYLAEYARQARAPTIVVIPSVIDLSRYSVGPHHDSEVFRIGWIGTPLTADYLLGISRALVEVGKKHRVRLVAVGAGNLHLEGVPLEIRAWTEESEVRDIQSFDVGIMPLPDTRMTRGKSGYKLIQYMGCGLPVVASPVGANADIVDNGVTGFLASSVDDWVRALDTLAGNAAMRAEMGIKGREKARTQFSVQASTPKLAKVLRAAAAGCAGELEDAWRR